MILNLCLIESHKWIEEPQQFESNEHQNQTRSSLPLIFRFPHFTLCATLCSFLNVWNWISPFAIVTWKTERTVNSWKSGKTENEKGFKIGSIWPVQSALWEQGIVGIVWGACSCWALWQTKFHSSWKTFKQLDRVKQFPPPHCPPTQRQTLCHYSQALWTRDWNWVKRKQKTPFVCSAFSFSHQTFQGNFN